MANYNIIKNFLNPKANMSRNGFDKSQSHKFTSKAGLITPIMCEEVVANSHFEISLQSLTRTRPLNTAAYVRMKENYDFVFVPFSVLWSQWNEFLDDTNDYQSAREQGHKFVPTVPLGRILANAWNEFFKARANDDEYFSGAWTDMHGYLAIYNILRILELLGYGDYYTIFDDWYNNGVSTAEGASRCLAITQRVNLFAILAYNKVFDDFYREPYWTPKYNAKDFNLDDIPCTSIETSYVEEYRQFTDIMKLFIPKYHAWKKDMITGVLPSAQFGDVSVLGSDSSKLLLDGSFNDDVGDETDPSVVHRVDSAGNDVWQMEAGVNTNWKLPNLFNVMQLKKAEVLQNWKIARMRAGDRVEKVAEAMHGSKPYHEMMHHSQFIGSFDNVVMIDEVLSNADTDGASLGAIGGKGIGTNQSGKLVFDSTESGYLMCLYYILPESGYNSKMLDKKHQKYEQFDFFNYHFEDLGFDPITVHELSMDFPLVNYTQEDVMNLHFGFLPRYYDYKTAIDKVHGELMAGRSLSDWTIQRSDIQLSTVDNQLGDEPRQTQFYVNPHILDTIFGVNSNARENTDQFITACNIQLFAVQPMSVLGLPNF